VHAQDAALAWDLAARAGEELLRLRSGGLSGTPLRAAADSAAHRLLAAGLAAERPDDVVFSEEAPDPRRRLSSCRVWIVDPLDGTREYGEPGRTDWAVHVALWADGRLVAGAVAVPALGRVYGTDPPPTVPAGPVARDGGVPRIAVSRSRPPAFATALAIDLRAQLVGMGSVGAKAAAVWRGEVDAYLHAGGLHEWDVAAPAVVAAAAGLHVSRIDGAAPDYNRPDPTLPDLVVCTPALAGPILDWTARHARELTQTRSTAEGTAR
jgi:3'(2'), 5'-bisphosphate nucleotidase